MNNNYVTMINNNLKMTNLKKLRVDKNLTQLGLSMEVAVSQELISAYELGKNKPNVENLIKLANYFNCSTDYLLDRTNNPTIIKDLTKKEIETNNILNKYESLSSENKKLFNEYLDFLMNKNK